MTAETRLAELLEIVEAPSNRGRLTHDWIAQNIGLEFADTIYAAINSSSPATALRFVAGVGIDTSADPWKRQAEAVAASIESLQPHLPTLRDFETIRQPRWQTEGYEKEPTLADVQAALKAEAQRVIDKRLTNATAFFSERMTVDGDANAIWLQAWIDAEAV